MHSGKPMKSLLGECQPGVCSAWASALQGHGCPAALWPVPGHQTRERKQHIRTLGCGQQCIPHSWDPPGKNTGVGCHFLLQCMEVKSESEVAQSTRGIRPRLEGKQRTPLSF